MIKLFNREKWFDLVGIPYYFTFMHNIYVNY